MKKKVPKKITLTHERYKRIIKEHKESKQRLKEVEGKLELEKFITYQLEQRNEALANELDKDLKLICEIVDRDKASIWKKIWIAISETFRDFSDKSTENKA